MSKISIRFWNDREVRAVWDEENSKWWFSAIDIIRAINKEDDYVKAGNYLKWKSVVPLFLNSDSVVCKYDAEEYMNENYLQPGDNVVVNGSDLYIGKKIN